jgi:hypothetical protein
MNLLSLNHLTWGSHQLYATQQVEEAEECERSESQCTKKKRQVIIRAKIVNDNQNQLIKFNNDFSPHPAYPACHRYHRVWIVDGCQSLCDAQVKPSTVMKPPPTYNYFFGDLI